MDTRVPMASLVTGAAHRIEPLSEATSRAAGELIRGILRDEFAKFSSACEDADLRGMARAFGGPGSAAWVVMEGDEVTGVAAVRETDAGALELKRLYVKSGWRGRGIGTELLARAERWAEVEGYQQIVVTTTTAMVRAQEVYRRHGFTRFGTESGDGTGLIRLRKQMALAPLGSRKPLTLPTHEGPGLIVAIERPRGTCEGWHWNRGDGCFEVTEHYDLPVPVNYGLAPDWINPADGDELDVIILDDRRMRVGDVIEAVPTGVLKRKDGDHKLLATPRGGAERPVALNETTRERVSKWWDDAHQPEGWDGEEGLTKLFAQCMRQGNRCE